MGADAFEHALAALLVHRFGAGTRIVGRTALSRRMATVTRLAMSGPNAPASVIVKHVPVDVFAPGRLPPVPEFVEEQVVHRFLDGIGATPGLKPVLLAHDPDGITVLEDLGPTGSPVVRTRAELMPRLVRALCRLHGRTLGREDEYQALRREAGLPPPDEDRRRHGPPLEAARAAHGRTGLLHLAGPWLPSPLLELLNRELDTVFALVERYPDVRALIHDDLANARQTFEIGGETLLLDFEYSHFAPPLYDLTKLLLGKFETEILTQDYRWVCPAMPLAFADMYRDTMMREYGLSFSDIDWKATLAACLVYAALALLGNLAAVGLERQLRGSVQSHINIVLDRLSSILAPWCPFPTLLGVVGAFRAKEPALPEGDDQTKPRKGHASASGGISRSEMATEGAFARGTVTCDDGGGAAGRTAETTTIPPAKAENPWAQGANHSRSEAESATR